MATYFYARGRWKEAVLRLKEAYTLQSAILGPTDPLTVLSTVTLGWVYYNDSDYDACENFIHPIWENIVEDVDREIQVGEITEILVRALIEKEEYELAESVIKRSISKLQDPTRGSCAWLLYHYLLGLLYRRQGNGAEAKQLLYSVLEACGLEPTQLDVQDVMSYIKREEKMTPGLAVKILNDLADLLEEEGQQEEAELMTQTFVDVCTKLYGALNISVIDAVSKLASLQEKLMKYESAGLMYQRAYRDSETCYGPSHPETLDHKQELEDFEARMEHRRQDSGIEDNTEQNTQPTSSQASDTGTII